MVILGVETSFKYPSHKAWFAFLEETFFNSQKVEEKYEGIVFFSCTAVLLDTSTYFVLGNN